jgi:hypothetical protein
MVLMTLKIINNANVLAADTIAFTEGGAEAMRIDSSGKLLSPDGSAFFGTVSNSGNGAIMERGSNANGDYVKFADGTLMCWGTRIFSFSSVTGGAVFFPFGSATYNFKSNLPVTATNGNASIISIAGDVLTAGGTTDSTARIFVTQAVVYPNASIFYTNVARNFGKAPTDDNLPVTVNTSYGVTAILSTHVEWNFIGRWY